MIKVNWAQVSKQRCLGFSNQMTSLNSQTFGLPFVKPIKMFRSRSAIFLKTLHIFQRDMMIGTKGHGVLQLSNKRQHHTDSYERYAEEVFLDDSCLDKEVR